MKPFAEQHEGTERHEGRRNFLRRTALISGALGFGALAPSTARAGDPRSADAKSFFNAKSLGAVGDGVRDDTAAIQRAINRAQNVGAVLFFPPGSYRISSSLFISSRLSILGSGYQGEGGQVYNVRTLSQSAGFLGTTFVCAPNVSCFLASTNFAVNIQGIHICYPTQPDSRSTAMIIRAADGPTSANTGTVLRDVLITGHANGIQLINCLDFCIEHCQLTLGYNSGIVLSSPNYPSFGDGTIANCLIWGHGVPQYQSSIAVYSGGGLRLANNKLNGGGINTNSVVVSPNVPGTPHNIEPLILLGNSIEGAGGNGILFNTASADAFCSGVSLVGNEIWAGTSAIYANTSPWGQWLNGFTISGNVLMVNAGSGKVVMGLDSAKNGIITGNSFNIAGSGVGTGVNLGADTSSINLQSNSYGPGLQPCSNFGAGNLVGGGSA